MTNNQQIILDIDAKVKSAQAATSLRELKQIVRELQGEALKYADVNEEAFQAASVAAGQLTDKMSDLRASTMAVSGEPLENISNGFTLIKSSITGLDFGQATTGIKLLTSNIKQLDFKKVGTEIKSVGTAFLDLGKAIASNPWLLLIGAVVALIANFDKLVKLGGFIGNLFKGIGDFVKSLKDGFFALTDAIGLTNTKMDEYAEKAAIAADVSEYLAQKQAEANIELQRLKGQSTIWDEYLIKQNKVKSAQKDFTNAVKEYGQASKEAGEAEKKLGEARIDLNTFISKNEIEINNQLEINRLKLERKRAENIKDARQRERELAIIDAKIQERERQKSFKKQIEDEKEFGESKKNMSDENRKQALDDLDKENADILNNKKKLQDDLAQINKNTSYDALLTYNKRAKQSKEIQEKIDALDKKYSENVEKRASINKKNQDDDVNIMVSSYEKQYNIQSTGEATKAEMAKAAGRNLNEINKKYALEDADDALKINAIKNEKIKANDKINEVERTKGIVTNLNERKVLTEDYYNIQLIGVKKGSNKEKLLLEQKSLEIQKIEKEKTDAIKKFNQDAAVGMAEAMNKFYQGQSTQAQTVEKDMTAIYQKVSENLDNEIQALQMGNEAAQMKYSERNVLVKAYWAMQSGIIEEARAKELRAIDDTVIDEEEKARRKYEINKHYDAKEKVLVAKSEKEKAAIRMEAIDKIAGYTRAAAGVISDIMDVSANKDAERVRAGSMTEADAKRKAFKRQKALSLVNVGINTAEAISKAVAASPTTGGLPFSAIAGVIGAAQIAAILSKKYDPGDGSGADTGGGGGGGGETVTAPTMAIAPSAPLMGQGYLNQNFNPMTFGGQLGFRPGGEQRVYVVESDITNSQNRVRVMESRSTLSGTV